MLFHMKTRVSLRYFVSYCGFIVVKSSPLNHVNASRTYQKLRERKEIMKSELFCLVRFNLTFSDMPESVRNFWKRL